MINQCTRNNTLINFLLSLKKRNSKPPVKFRVMNIIKNIFVLAMSSTITNGAKLIGINNVFRAPHSNANFASIPIQLNEHHARVNDEAAFLDSLFTDGNRTAIKSDAIEIMKQQFTTGLNEGKFC